MKMIWCLMVDSEYRAPFGTSYIGITNNIVFVYTSEHCISLSVFADTSRLV